MQNFVYFCVQNIPRRRTGEKIQLMKRIILLAIITFLPLPFMAKEGGRGLSKLLEKCIAQEEIHPDSIFSSLRMLEARRGEVRTPQEKAMYSTALGRLYALRMYRSQSVRLQTQAHPDSIQEWSREDYQLASRKCFADALKDKDLLFGMSTRDWLPLVWRGKDESVYGSNMLIVVWRTMQESVDMMEASQESSSAAVIHLPGYAEMVAYYKEKGMREAAFFLDMEQADQNWISRKAELERICREYADLPEVAQAHLARIRSIRGEDDAWRVERSEELSRLIERYSKYKNVNALKNELLTVQQPEFTLSAMKLCHTGAEQKWVVKRRNLSAYTVSLYRLPDDFQEDKWDNETLVKWLKKKASVVKVFTGPQQQGATPASASTKTKAEPSLQLVADPLRYTIAEHGHYALVAEAKTPVPLQHNVLPEVMVLHATRLYPIWMTTPEGVRLTVVDAVTGKPQQGVKVTMTYTPLNRRDTLVHIQSCTTNKRGVIMMPDRTNYSVEVSMEKDDDRFHPQWRLYTRYYGTEDETSQHYAVNTDRSIYRPGQLFQMVAVAYDRRGWDAEVKEGKKVRVELRDADHKVLKDTMLVTDEFGTISFSCDIPATAKPGSFRLIVGNNTYHNIRVEEYKRPTFEVSMDEPVLGDSIIFTGKALTYAGVAVANARVTGEYRWSQGWWARYGGVSQYHSPKRIDTLYTDDKGQFRVAVSRNELDERELRGGKLLTLMVDVLNSAGETQHGSQNASLCSSPLRLYTEVQELQDKDRLKPNRFVLIDALGNEVEADVKVDLMTPRKPESLVFSTTVPANKEVTLDGLRQVASGDYVLRVQAVVKGDTVRTNNRVVLFSMRDETLPTDTLAWFYVPSHKLTPEQPLQIQVGSSMEDVEVFCLVTNQQGRLYKESVLTVSNSLKTISLPYNEDMGEAIAVTLCFVKNGKMFTHNVTALTEKPETKLKANWTTFRDKLRPGQEETWKLRLTRQDGTPAAANVMLTLYDASLDALARHSVSIPVYRNRRVPSAWMSDYYNECMYGYLGFDLKLSKEYVWEFSRLDDKYFQPRLAVNSRGNGRILYAKGTAPRMALTAGSSIPQREVYSAKGVSAREFESLAVTSADEALQGRIAGLDVVDNSAELDNGAATKLRGAALREESIETDDPYDLNHTTDWSALRTNLTETAFFYPQLRTDGNGEVSIEFTLPESLTRWHLLGVAHSQDLYIANIDENVVAQKELMAQLFLPRFLRVGDKAVLTANIQNIDEARQHGTAVFDLLDAKTEKVVLRKKVKFDLAAKTDSVFYFDYDVRNDANDLICRWIANGQSCSDGEQRRLPVLTDRESLVRTKALWLDNKGSYSYDLGHLFPADASNQKLTIEYTTHPLWSAIQTLSTLFIPKHEDVLSLVSSYYASTLCLHLHHQVKDIDKVVSLNKDSLEVSRLRALEKLKELQRHDGSFNWFPGLMGNEYLTREVAFQLARLNQLLDEEDEKTAEMLEDAIRYLRSKLNKDTGMGTATLRHLYVVSVIDKSLDNNEKRLLKELAKVTDTWSLEDRALASIVLHLQDKNRATNRMMDGVEKYLVGTPETGRYIDYPSGSFTSIDRKIHIHTQIMEAVKMVRPNDKELWQGMQKWLLQEKRTTDWTTPINTVDAVHALLYGGREELQDGAQDVLDVKGRKQIQRLMSPDNQKGYLKTEVEVLHPQKLDIQKRSAGESWGAIYAEFEQQIDSVSSAWQGINIRREISTLAPKIGDRVHLRYVITATRDYDYVLLHAPRPSCTEPAVQLSGYQYSNGLGFYRMMRDSATDYYICHLPRGTYVLEEDVMVERAGQYSAGITKVECLYAPEFRAYTGNLKMTPIK